MMDNLRELYYGIQDAYDLIYPWIPSSFKYSLQSFMDNSWVIVHTLFTNPSDLKYLIPSIISTLTFIVSVYWTVSSLYFALRRGLRITIFLLKYGSIVALLLAGLGWTEINRGDDEVTFPNAVASGFQTVMRYANNFAQTPTPPPGPGFSSQTGPGKPWERFASSDSPSSNSRSKSRAAGRKGKTSSSDGPFGDIDPTKILSWISSLREGGEDHEGTAIERTLRELWEKNPDAWADLSFMKNKGEDSDTREGGTSGTR